MAIWGLTWPPDLQSNVFLLVCTALVLLGGFGAAGLGAKEPGLRYWGEPSSHSQQMPLPEGETHEPLSAGCLSPDLGHRGGKRVRGEGSTGA